MLLRVHFNHHYAAAVGYSVPTTGKWSSMRTWSIIWHRKRGARKKLLCAAGSHGFHTQLKEHVFHHCAGANGNTGIASTGAWLEGYSLRADAMWHYPEICLSGLSFKLHILKLHTFSRQHLVLAPHTEAECKPWPPQSLNKFLFWELTCELHMETHMRITTAESPLHRSEFHPGY